MRTLTVIKSKNILMKRLILFSVFLAFFLHANSQEKLDVVVGKKTMSKGEHMGITLIIPETNPKDVEPLWKKFVNNRSFGERLGNLATQVGNIFKSEENQTARDKLKVEKNGDEFYVRSIEQSSITNHPMDIYARLTQLPEGCQFSAFFQYTDSIFIDESNADKERIESMKSYIREFGVLAYRSVVDEQIKNAKKEVSKQEGVLKDIESDSRKEEKAISRYEVDIQEYNAGIREVQNDIKRLDETIATKKLAFSQLKKDDLDYGTSKAELKTLARDKSKNFGKIKSLNAKIRSKEMDIKSSKGKVTQNDLRLSKQQLVIDEKESIVSQLEKKKEQIE